MTPEEEQDHKTDWYQPAAREISSQRLALYSRFVGSMKLALPLLAAGVVLVLMIWPSTQPSSPPPRKATAVDQTMQAPIYTSRDEKGQPFKVIADSAKQNPTAANVMDLTHPKGTIELEGGSSIAGDAVGAQYDQTNGKLSINGNLTLHHSSGAVFQTQRAEVDMNSKTASGDAPVKVTGGFGEVDAQGFELQNEGKTVIFKGQATAHLKMGGGGNPADAMKGLMPTTTPVSAPQSNHPTSVQSLTAQPLSGAAPLTVSFSSLCTNTAWFGGVRIDYGDTTPADSLPKNILCGVAAQDSGQKKSLTHTYHAAGKYSVRLLGSGEGNLEVLDTITINVSGNPSL